MRTKLLWIGIVVIATAALFNVKAGIAGSEKVLRYGEVVNGTIDGGNLAFYQFSGSAGDLVTIQVTGNTTFVHPLTELKSDGQTIMAADSIGRTQMSLILAHSAVYTIVVTDADRLSGDFVLQLSGQKTIIQLPMA